MLFPKISHGSLHRVTLSSHATPDGGLVQISWQEEPAILCHTTWFNFHNSYFCLKLTGPCVSLLDRCPLPLNRQLHEERILIDFVHSSLPSTWHSAWDVEDAQ